MNARAIQKNLQGRHEDMMQLLERLVYIDNRSTNKGGVDETGRILKREYEKLGFIAERRRYGTGRGMMCSEFEFLEIDTMVPCASRLALTISKLA